MKKKMILLLWLTTISLVAFSQDFRKLGIGVGYGTSSIVGDSIHPMELSLRYRLDRKHTFPVFRTFFATPANYLIIKYNILFLGVAKKIICILENL